MHCAVYVPIMLGVTCLLPLVRRAYVVVNDATLLVRVVTLVVRLVKLSVSCEIGTSARLSR